MLIDTHWIPDKFLRYRSEIFWNDNISMFRNLNKPMNLKEQIKDDLKISMKSGDEIQRTVLRSLNAEIKNAEIAKKESLGSDEILEVISRNAKRHKDSIEQYGEGGRDDLVEQEEKELKILQKYLPEQMGEEEVRKIIREIIKGSGVSDFGKAMGMAMGKLKGKADGNLVSKIVKEELGN